MQDGIKVSYKSRSESFHLEVDRRTLMDLLVGGGATLAFVESLADDLIRCEPASKTVALQPQALLIVQGTLQAVATDSDGNVVSTAEAKPLSDG